MRLRSQLETLKAELELLKREGEDSVYLSDAGLEILERWKGSASPTESPGRPHPPADRSASRRNLGLESTADRVDEAPKKVSKKETAPALPPAPTVELPDGDKETRWKTLREQVVHCETCTRMVKPGKQVVFGVGNLDADLFFCGEAPGSEEEVQGEPFVGPAGQLLTKVIEAMGLSREEVYIGNIMNWRPDTDTGFGNRPPTGEEMAFCLPYLKAQLEIVQPQVIVALGATAVKGLQGLDKNPRMGDLRGNWKAYEGIPLMVTYHPSYLLRNQSKKRKREVWEDMLQVMEKISLPISEKQRGYFL